jgi:membrane fusion protein, multidrug efflux system
MNKSLIRTRNASADLDGDTSLRNFERQIALVRPLLNGACALGLALLATGCKPTVSAAASYSPPEVGVASVVSREVRQSNEFNGRVAAVEYVDVRPRVTGYVDRFVFREGDEVKRGQLLFVIDPRPYRDALESAKAGLDHARAVADFAKIQEQRAQTLDSAKAISREEYQNRSSDLSQSVANVHAAEAAVATAELHLEFTEVRSPINGRVSRAQFTAGNLAQADQTVLTTVVSQDPVYVYFDCDEQSYLRYKNRTGKGERVNAENPVRVALANESGFPHAGRIDFLDNTVNPSTGTIRARVVMANPNHSFTPGLYARVQLQNQAEQQAILIDDKAVMTDQDRKYVYVLGPGNKALRKDVTLGPLIDGLRIVQSGLASNDKVIVTNLQKIFYPGVPVTPKDTAMDASSSASPATSQIAAN